MKQTLTTGQAADMLLADDNANWTYAGAHALITNLEEMEDETSEEIEFDRVAIRCEYSEYKNAMECCRDCGLGISRTPDKKAVDGDDDLPIPGENEEEKEALALAFLNENTTVIKFDGGIIIVDF